MSTEAGEQPLANLESHALHGNYSREFLANLQALDKVMEARRQSVNSATTKLPKTHTSRERLRKYLAEEPGRLERSFNNLLETKLLPETVAAGALWPGTVSSADCGYYSVTKASPEA